MFREDIVSAIKRHIENNRECIEANEKLLKTVDKSEWIERVKKYSIRKAEIIKDNNEIIKMLEEYWKTPLSLDEDPSYVDALYNLHKEFKDTNVYDYLVAGKLAKFLCAYFREKKDYERLAMMLRLCTVAENSRAFAVNQLRNNNEFYQELKDISENIDDIRDPKAVRIILLGWNNYVISVRNPDGSRNVAESQRRFEEYLDFFRRHNIEKRIEEDPLIDSAAGSIYRDMLLAEDELYHMEGAELTYFENHLEYVYEYERKTFVNSYKLSSVVMASKIRLDVKCGRISWKDAIEQFMTYFKEKLDHASTDEIDEDEFYSYIRIPRILYRWLWGTQAIDNGLSEIETDSYFEEVCKLTDRMYFDILPEYYGMRNDNMAKWCFKVIPRLKGNSKKRAMIMKYVYRQQLPTFIHSKMVAMLSKLIYFEIKKVMPQVLNEVYQVAGEDIDDMIYESAILHDLGKTKIPDIINMWGRNLTEEEFATIKLHPETGAKLLSYGDNTEMLMAVALGHHKSYDCQKGYPENVDYRDSPYRIIVDIVHIADCLDAATDHFGRVKPTFKSLDDVLNELSQGEEYAYNPDVVDIISTSKILETQIRTLVEERRLDLMYDIYQAVGTI